MAVIGPPLNKGTNKENEREEVGEPYNRPERETVFATTSSRV